MSDIIIDPNNLPEYVSLKGTELRRGKNDYEDSYYRDAGQWGVGYEIRDGKLFSTFYDKSPYLHDVELIPITKEQYENGNQGYL